MSVLCNDLSLPRAVVSMVFKRHTEVKPATEAKVMRRTSSACRKQFNKLLFGTVSLGTS